MPPGQLFWIPSTYGKLRPFMREQIGELRHAHGWLLQVYIDVNGKPSIGRPEIVGSPRTTSAAAIERLHRHMASRASVERRRETWKAA